MRKFLLILACSFSFFVRAETNITVTLTQQQFNRFVGLLDYIGNNSFGSFFPYGDYPVLSSDGSISSDYWEGYIDQFPQAIYYNADFIGKLLHLIISGSVDGSYDTSTNNILAYASSLRSHNEVVRSYLIDLAEEVSHMRWTLFPTLFSRQNDFINSFHSDYTNNFERLYDAITNIDFKVSISNQIDLLQSMNGSISNNLDGISNALSEISQDIRNFHDDFVSGNTALDLEMAIRHHELMEFLHTLTNGALFASNLCNCCGGSNSNYQDSVLAMLNWITNNFPDVAESPIGGGGGSNNVWSIWRPSGVPSSGWFHLFVPTVEWVQSGNDSQQFKPQYGDYQYDSVYNAVWDEYNNLLENFRANGIDGQQFLAGLVDLQLHIMANMSTQLYMIDQKMPSKTNLWWWIEEYKNKVSDEVTKAERENSEIVSSVSSLLNYTPFSIVGGHFPKVSNALNSLRVEQDSSPVVRIPIPRALRVSDSDALVVDVRESDWFSIGRDWCRWIFTFIWGWLFIRLGLVPIFYVFFYTLRIAEIAAHLVLMGSVRGSSGVVSSFGASAVDLVLSLLGIDTDFKRFVWGIMRD